MIAEMVDQMGQMNPMGPRGGTDTTLLWVIIALLVIIIGYLWYSNRGKESPDVPSVGSLDVDKIEVAMRLLSPNERLVVEFLMSHDGEMLQKDISFELDFTRVQAHRVVQSLAQRDIVSVEDHYNTKKIIIADWLLR